MMITEKATPNNNDDISHNGYVPLPSIWSDNSVYVGNDVHHNSQFWTEATANDVAGSIFAIPSCGLHVQRNMEGLDSYLFRSYASTVEHRPVLLSVEVDVVSGKIRFELEHQNSNEAPTSPQTPMRKLNHSQKLRLIAVMYKWARKTVTVPGKAARTYTPKVTRGVRRSVKAIIQSASYMRQVSRKSQGRVVELNQNHDIESHAKLAMKKTGKPFKEASNTAAVHVQQSSRATARVSKKELEEEHHLTRTSKRNIKKGGKRIHNI